MVEQTFISDPIIEIFDVETSCVYTLIVDTRQLENNSNLDY
jgi:hypothetical protein